MYVMPASFTPMFKVSSKTHRRVCVRCIFKTKEAIEVLKQVHDRYCQMPFDGNPTFAT